MPGGQQIESGNNGNRPSAKGPLPEPSTLPGHPDSVDQEALARLARTQHTPGKDIPVYQVTQDSQGNIVFILEHT